jgi:hypothetical protein
MGLIQVDPDRPSFSKARFISSTFSPSSFYKDIYFLAIDQLAEHVYAPAVDHKTLGLNPAIKNPINRKLALWSSYTPQRKPKLSLSATLCDFLLSKLLKLLYFSSKISFIFFSSKAKKKTQQKRTLLVSTKAPNRGTSSVVLPINQHTLLFL